MRSLRFVFALSIFSLSAFAMVMLAAAPARGAASPASSDALDHPMTFALDDDPLHLIFTGVPVVYATGTITADTPRLFEAFQRQGNILDEARVVLNSPGGDLTAGMSLGRLFRQGRMATAVGAAPTKDVTGKLVLDAPAVCASACAYAYFGGEYRYAPATNAGFGIHQFYYANRKVADVGEVQQAAGEIVTYLRDMGINPGVFAAAATKTGSQVLWVSGVEMLEYGLANDGVQPATSELKQVKGQAYLVVDQKSYDGEHKVTFMCVKNALQITGYYLITPVRAKELVSTGIHSYLEINEHERYGMGPEGALALNQSVITARSVPLADFAFVSDANSIGAWLNDAKVPGLRTGFTIKLASVRAALRDYYRNCQAANDSAKMSG